MRYLWLLLILAGCGGGGDSGCVQPVVTVQIFGDSTQAGAGTSPGHKPADLLRGELDKRFGVGATVVIDSALGGTRARDAILGENGLAKWPADVRGDVVVANWGVNDVTDYGSDEYRAFLRQLAPRVTLFETPVPIVPGAAVRTDAFSQIMRKVAAEWKRPVADAQATVLATPAWEAMYADDFHHPGDALTAIIVSQALAPAVAAQVTVLRCP